ncbi:Hypothetical predicted protein [Mytilus galloprovincialis]|uniref:Tyrosinase copper-binding domain-containing protein n=1 Tax=Mytilus galloprovincialis TaxID=29158 RepID=A0A8B6EZC8_MYTGA|nr:Hypothetical predicted protein [Mytilus galloprovincialis]
MRSYYLLMVFIPASALIVEDVFPPSLAECYSGQVDKNTTPYDVQTSCLERFLGHMYKNTSSIDLGKDAFDWFDSLGRKLHTRLRRQTRYRLRERKEIRTLSQTELINFFDAVNALKNDKSVKPNKYDSFAIMHQGDVGASAHDGPNFVSWHRYFLVLFENALREKNSKVTLPYWDSRADYLMTNKEDSILFTEFFSGEMPKGVVYADAPTCDNNCGKAFRGFLYCDRSKKGCVSGSRFDFIKFGGFSHVTNYYPSKGKGRKTQIPLSMSKLQSAPAPSMAADKSIRSGTIFSILKAQRTKILSATESAPKSTTLFRTHFDNTAARARRSADFSLIGNSFKIGFDLNLRLKQEMKNLSSLKSASYQFDNLALSPIAIINRHNRYRYPGQDGTKNQRTFSITFQTEGFSYNGRHIDFISIDERTQRLNQLVLLCLRSQYLVKRKHTLGSTTQTV